MCHCQGRIKGGVQGVQAPPPPPKFSEPFFKSEGKEVNIFLGLQFFQEEGV